MKKSSAITERNKWQLRFINKQCSELRRTMLKSGFITTDIELQLFCLRTALTKGFEEGMKAADENPL